MNTRLFFGAGLLGILLAFSGCGNNVRVTGKVTFEDGQPLTAGRVCFQTDTFFADGAVQEDGSYTIGSVGENSGLPKGTYQVFITGAANIPEMDIATGRATTPQALIHKKFTDRTTSEWTCDVKGKTVFDITVTPP